MKKYNKLAPVYDNITSCYKVFRNFQVFVFHYI